MPKPFAAALVALALSLALAGCATSPPPSAPVSSRPGAAAVDSGAPSRRSLAQGLGDYQRAVARIEGPAERLCRDANPGTPSRHCNFEFRLVDDPRIGPNAFQTLRPDGRPVVAMTVQLVALSDNADEIAFVLGHEAGHHVAGHIARSRSQAVTGALVLGTIASLGNASDEVVRDMVNLGAALGGRAYSQSYELEADYVGALIAMQAGYDPERGARVFAGPELAGGGGLLSTHPASAQRQAAVTAAVAEIRRTQPGGLAKQARRGGP